MFHSAKFFLSRALYTLVIAICSYFPCQAQEQQNLLELSEKIRLAGSISNKAMSYAEKISSLQEASLHGIEEAEQKLFQKLKIVPNNLSQGTDVESLQSMLEKKLKSVSDKALPSLAISYLPKLDSMLTSLKFLQEHSQLSENAINLPLKNLEELQRKINKLQAVQEVVMERKALIESKLRSLGKLGKEFQRYNATLSSYKSKFELLKADFDQPDKLITKALGLLAQRKEFRQFFSKNSMMAGFMRLPVEGETTNTKGLEGLQTRKDIEKLLTDRFGSVPAIPGVSKRGGSMPGMPTYLASLDDMPGMKELLKENDLVLNGSISPQAKRRFKDMLHLGVNIQTTRATGIFPTTTDIGLSLGIDLTDRLTSGIGVAGKLGLGQSIQNMKLSAQGLSLRSFVDGKIKGGIYLTASAEMNYLKEITKIEQLKDMSAWKFAGLAGLTKKFRLNQKTQANIQLLYDFFYRANGVQTQPLVFRFGYSF
jgi:hypothetical protein